MNADLMQMAADVFPSGKQTLADQKAVIIGQSPAISDIIEKASIIARTQAPVLILGESGTGKDLLARLIHERGSRSARPFVCINCAALPRDVIENELFGHEREAFTGANSRKPGCFELADGGTLFLDEIGEMHTHSQAKLLRVLETGSVRPLGGKGETHVNVRVIAATNKNIVEAMKNGSFREDLYYRLSVIELAMPPLRHHPEDVPALTEHFLQLFCEKYGIQSKTFSEESLALLRGFHWPGNVRELRNMVERAVLLCPENTITPSHLSQRMATNPQADMISLRVGISMSEVEREVIRNTLSATGNNKAKTARVLGLSRKALYNKISRLGI